LTPLCRNTRTASASALSTGESATGTPVGFYVIHQNIAAGSLSPGCR
jgi:hypothetical protein